LYTENFRIDLNAQRDIYIAISSVI